MLAIPIAGAGVKCLFNTALDVCYYDKKKRLE